MHVHIILSRIVVSKSTHGVSMNKQNKGLSTKPSQKTVYSNNYSSFNITTVDEDFFECLVNTKFHQSFDNINIP